MTVEKEIQKTDNPASEPARESNDRPVFVPPANVVERDLDIVITAELPGVSEDRVAIELDHGVLTLQGESLPDEVEGYELLYRDYRSGLFKRSFTLPAEIDQKGIQAKIKNGVLTLVLPKSQEAQPRKIAVQAAE